MDRAGGSNAPRSYTLTLIVTDNGDLTGSDAVTMTVSADPPLQNPNTCADRDYHTPAADSSRRGRGQPDSDRQ